MTTDQRLLLMVGAVMFALIVVVSVLAPQSAEDDPRPTTYNFGPQGAKAAYLLFQRLGRLPSRWERPLAELSHIDASRTTLLLAEPLYAATDRDGLAAELKKFLERGGRVLATGPSGALLLPGGAIKPPGMFQSGPCTTTPEGPGALARAGQVSMADHGRWASEAPPFRVEQRCGSDAVVVRYAVSGVPAVQAGGIAARQGEAVWWSSATPLTNAGLKQDADLRLLLASVGSNRDVVFDESLHRQTASIWDAAKGLPLRWLAWQTAALFLLLVLSFSRRRGPVRSPVTLPRSSPLEFAESMGELYEKAGASSAATEAARRRLLGVLAREAGGPQAGGPLEPNTEQAEADERFAEALRERVGGDWSRLTDHLRAAEMARQTEISPHSALVLVRALSEDAEAVQMAFAPARQPIETTVESGSSQEREPQFAAGTK